MNEWNLDSRFFVPRAVPAFPSPDYEIESGSRRHTLFHQDVDFVGDRGVHWNLGPGVLDSDDQAKATGFKSRLQRFRKRLGTHNVLEAARRVDQLGTLAVFGVGTREPKGALYFLNHLAIVNWPSPRQESLISAYFFLTLEHLSHAETNPSAQCT